jgi:hypothetical protein
LVNLLTQELVEWSKRQLEVLRRGLDMMEAGTFHTGERRGSGELIDTTPETMETNRRQIRELEDLLRQIEEEHA